MNALPSEKLNPQRIEHLNDANLVLRHFIELSGKLLPFLGELSQKFRPSMKEITDKNRIIDVYQNYNFDPQASQMLMGSPILELIQHSYEAIIAPNHARGMESQYYLGKFQAEYVRLKEQWNKIERN